MPNWCSNELRIEGNDQEIEKFLKKAKGTEEGEVISLQRLIPMPNEIEMSLQDMTKEVVAMELEDLIEKSGASGWYDWRLKHWGVKWDIGRVDSGMEQEPGRVYMSFLTPWGPPDRAFLEIARQFPKLSFELEFHESGMVRHGRIHFEGGVLTEEEELPEPPEELEEDSFEVE